MIGKTRKEVFQGFLEMVEVGESSREKKNLLELIFVDLLKIHNEAKSFPPELQEILRSAVTRLNTGEPVQYITNIAHFYGLQFYVDHNVLIPRMETEELVFEALQILDQFQLNRNPRVLDVGTGSGCIAITLKKEHLRAVVDAIDVSQSALHVAQKNASSLQAQVTFSNQDLFDIGTKGTSSYDLIISNPPYITQSEKDVMTDQVLKFEPAVALFAPDDDPLGVYQALLDLGKKSLRNGGFLLVEINEFWGHKLMSLPDVQLAFHSELLKDMQGKDRILKARKKT